MNYSSIKDEAKRRLQKLLLQIYKDIKLHNEEMGALIAAKDEVEIKTEEELRFLEDLERDAVLESQEVLKIAQKLISTYEKF